VMIILLSIGEAMVSQARNEKLIGGGTITVLPQGLDIVVMKTGGIGGLFLSIDHESCLCRHVLASPRYRGEIVAVAPQIEGRLLYLRTGHGHAFPVHASGEIPSGTRAVGAAPGILKGTWQNDDGDRRWIAPTPLELGNEIDHFHVPSDTVANRDTWAEWHYFNVLYPDRKRWAFISFIVGGDVVGTKWHGQVGVTLREENGSTRRFAATVDRSRVRFSTNGANLMFGDSHVIVTPDGDYDVRAAAREESGSMGVMTVALRVRPAPYAYFPGVSAIHILLDYFIDQAEDRAHGELNFVACYASSGEAVTRLRRLVTTTLAHLRNLAGAAHHRFVLEAMCGFYLTHPKVFEQHPDLALIHLLRRPPPTQC